MLSNWAVCDGDPHRSLPGILPDDQVPAHTARVVPVLPRASLPAQLPAADGLWVAHRVDSHPAWELGGVRRHGDVPDL